MVDAKDEFEVKDDEISPEVDEQHSTTQDTESGKQEVAKQEAAKPDDSQPPERKPAVKIKVHFVAVGSAPMMKKTKFQISADQRFGTVTSFLRKMLKLKDTGNSLFLYCSSCFVPSPDELLAELDESFSVRGELVIHYSLQEAWG